MRQTWMLFVCAAMLLINIPGRTQDSTGGKLTLKQAVETGLEHNLLVNQAGLQSQAGEINWKQARLNRLPDLNGSIDAGKSQGRSVDPFTNSYINQNVNFMSYGLGSGVVLFSGMSLSNSVKQTSFGYQADKLDWQQAKDNLTINIILSYLQVLSTEDQLIQAQNQAALSAKQVERLEILNRDGAIAPSLLSDLKGQYANDQLNIANLQNTLVTSKINLYEFMNIPYDRNTNLERMDTVSFASVYDNTSDQIYQSALINVPQVKAMDFRTRSAARGVMVARGALFPTLSLNGNANTNYSSVARSDIFVNTSDVVSTDYVVVGGVQTPVVRKQNNFDSQKIPYGKQLNGNLYTTFSLNLTIPIFNSFLARNRVKLAKITLKNWEMQSQTTKTQLQQAVEQAFTNMASARDRYKIITDQVAAYEESFKAADIRFNSGVGTSIDYITAKNNLDRANINLINARYDAVLRLKILDYYQGKQLW
jgi:outer membrane protein